MTHGVARGGAAVACLLLLVAVVRACRAAPPSPDPPDSTAVGTPSEEQDRKPTDDATGGGGAASPEDREFAALIQGFAAAARGNVSAPTPTKWPDGLTVDGQCPATDPEAEKEMAAQASALIPLKVDLTLSSIWRASDGDYDVECLTRVSSVEPGFVRQASSCSMKGRTEEGSRRTCRADLRGAYMFHSAYGELHPERIEGATDFSLSAASFAELKTKGETRHRNVMVGNEHAFVDLEGVLKREHAGTVEVIVNDRPVSFPVIRAAGMLKGVIRGKPVETMIEAAILDDERFPLVLDYRSRELDFFLTYTKVSFPTEGALEKQLLTQKRVDVYGIYFDFASDRIRSESSPVLMEIADILSRHPDWHLSIEGHTDNVGGPASNLTLSQRRSNAVRETLMAAGVSASRLATAGFGESVPKDTNDTPKGRARNRRVELVRR